MLPRIKKETLVSMVIFVTIFSIGLLVASPRLSEDLPIGVDSSSHLFKVLHLYKTYTQYGYIPSWSSEWYGGTPFLYFYPPLAYLLTFFIALFGLEPIFAYKVVETFFYAIAPITVYFLSREIGFEKSESIFAGLFFSLTPMVIENFLFYDRFTTIISVPILCLFLIAFIRALRSKRILPLIYSSFLLTILILIHHLTAYYLGILIIFLAVVQYFKTKNAKEIAKKTVFIGVSSLFSSAFWLFPFLSSVFSIHNPFYNRSIADNFITPGIFSWLVFLIGLLQFFTAILEVSFHMFSSVKEVKNPIVIFRLLFPSISIIVGSLISYWLVKVGQLLVILGFIAFSLSFLMSIRDGIKVKANLIFCTLWFVAFLWLGLGYYALLITVLPFYEKLDSLRFLFYLTIPQSILSARFFKRVLSSFFSSGFTFKKISLRRRIRSPILASCLILILFVNLYLVENDYLAPPKEFAKYEQRIPQEIVDFFKLEPHYARILAVRCPDWIYVLPIYTGKPLIDGWYPQQKVLKTLLWINDYQINTLNMYNGTERVKIWNSLIGNASKLGIKWVLIGDPTLTSIMTNYPDFGSIQTFGNLTIYESKAPISLVEIENKNTISNLVIEFSSPGKIVLKIDNVTRKIDVTVKEAYFTGWEVSVDNVPIDHYPNEDGFITFQLEAGLHYSITMNYEGPNISMTIVSLVTLLSLFILFLIEHHQGSASRQLIS